MDGSELLVEEQGAVSKIISADSSSLADMEVSGQAAAGGGGVALVPRYFVPRCSEM